MLTNVCVDRRKLLINYGVCLNNGEFNYVVDNYCTLMGVNQGNPGLLDVD